MVKKTEEQRSDEWQESISLEHILPEKYQHYSVDFFSKYSDNKIREMLSEHKGSHKFTEDEIKEIIRIKNRYNRRIKKRNREGVRTFHFDQSIMNEINKEIMGGKK